MKQEKDTSLNHLHDHHNRNLTCPHFFHDDAEKFIHKCSTDETTTTSNSDYGSSCSVSNHKESHMRPNQKTCSSCHEDQDIWLCTSCHLFHCGRYSQGHALEHAQDQNHPVAKSIHDNQYHCYVCDRDFVYPIDNFLNKMPNTPITGKKSLSNDTSATPNANNSSDNSTKTPATATNHHRQRGRRKHEKRDHITGIVNLGNTCFVNVIIQTLYHSILFREKVLELEHSFRLLDCLSDNQRITRRQSAIGKDANLFRDLCELIVQMWHTNNQNIDPEKFMLEMWKVGPTFHEFQQQDAQEFLRFLLDKIQREAFYKSSQISLASMFHGVLVSKIVCEKCGRISKKHDSFYDLSLSIPEKYLDVKNKVRELSDPCLITECLQNFTSEEHLVDNDQYKCPNCQSYENCVKKLTIKKVPEILSVHIKRFRWARSLRTKIDTYIEFPILNLDLSPYSDMPPLQCIYDLYAVIVHHGSAGSGHYIVYCWSAEHDSWFEINDHEATPISADDVLEQSAYMLFYLRRSLNKNLMEAIDEQESNECISQQNASSKSLEAFNDINHRGGITQNVVNHTKNPTTYANTSLIEHDQPQNNNKTPPRITSSTTRTSTTRSKKKNENCIKNQKTSYSNVMGNYQEQDEPQNVQMIYPPTKCPSTPPCLPIPTNLYEDTTIQTNKNNVHHTNHRSPSSAAASAIAFVKSHVMSHLKRLNSELSNLNDFSVLESESKNGFDENNDDDDDQTEEEVDILSDFDPKRPRIG